jgi:hypothetical protein
MRGPVYQFPKPFLSLELMVGFSDDVRLLLSRQRTPAMLILRLTNARAISSPERKEKKSKVRIYQNFSNIKVKQTKFYFLEFSKCD